MMVNYKNKNLYPLSIKDNIVDDWQYEMKFLSGKDALAIYSESFSLKMPAECSKVGRFAFVFIFVLNFIEKRSEMEKWRIWWFM